MITVSGIKIVLEGRKAAVRSLFAYYVVRLLHWVALGFTRPMALGTGPHYAVRPSLLRAMGLRRRDHPALLFEGDTPWFLFNTAHTHNSRILMIISTALGGAE